MEQTIKTINQRFGAGSIFNLADPVFSDVHKFTTGFAALDLALGGGIPEGRIVEIVGPEGSGKTSLALAIAGMVQRTEKGNVAIIDVEHALDPEWAVCCGLIPEMSMIAQPDSGDQALQLAEEIIRQGQVKLVIFDSVAQMVPLAELQGEMGDAHIALRARLMSQALRKLSPLCGSMKTTMIFINQFRLKIGIAYGDPRVTPGGEALKYAASIRLFLGADGKATVKKNKVSAPGGVGWFGFNPSGPAKGVEPFGSLRVAGEALQLVERNRGWCTFPDGTRINGTDAANAHLAQNHELAKKLWTEIRKATHTEYIPYPFEPRLYDSIAVLESPEEIINALKLQNKITVEGSFVSIPDLQIPQKRGYQALLDHLLDNPDDLAAAYELSRSKPLTEDANDVSEIISE